MQRRNLVTTRRGSVRTVLFALLYGYIGALSAGEVQNLKLVEAAAQQLLQANQPDGALVQVGKLDSRLRLAVCRDGLEPFLPPGARRGSNTTVGVRCLGPVMWKVFITARVRISAGVITATRAMPRGTVLGAGDLRVEQRDTTLAPVGAIGDLSLAIGKRLRQPLLAGRPITESMLDILPVIRRGQHVTLLAETGTLVVRMAGRALSDGRPGERIRVRNSSSERIVEGVVVDSLLVRIEL